MLSDGAAAMLLSDQPNDHRTSLAIRWVDGISYAHELEPCMYAGAIKVDGGLLPWPDASPEAWLEQSMFAIKQDIKLLEAYVIPKGVQSIQEVLRKHRLSDRDIDHFLPHISSYFFKARLAEPHHTACVDIPLNREIIK